MIDIVVAYDRIRTIGRDNQLPWRGEQAADMRRFRELTIGRTVLMGRRTLESIGFALPGRRNLILTSQYDFEFEGCETVHSLSQAYDMTEYNLCVIGGQTVYEQSLPKAARVYATEFDMTIPDGDAFFPDLDETKWDLTQSHRFSADSNNKHDYKFEVYERKLHQSR